MNIGLMSILSRLPMMGGAASASDTAAPDAALFQGLMAQTNQASATQTAQTGQGLLFAPVAVTVVAKDEADDAAALLDSAPPSGSVDVVATLDPNAVTAEHAVPVMEVTVSDVDALAHILKTDAQATVPVAMTAPVVLDALDVTSEEWQLPEEGLPAAVVYSPATLSQQVTIEGVALNEDGTLDVEFDVEPAPDAVVVPVETVPVAEVPLEAVPFAAAIPATESGAVPLVADDAPLSAAAPISGTQASDAASRPVMAAVPLPAEAIDDTQADVDDAVKPVGVQASEDAFDEALDDVIQRILDARPQTAKNQSPANPMVAAHSAVLQQQALAQQIVQDGSADSGAEAVDLQSNPVSAPQVQPAQTDKTNALPTLHSKAYMASDKAPVAEQVVVTIRQALKGGIDHMVVQLDPVDLGRVEVRMDITKDGKATVMMVVENRDTLAALQRDARGLEQALQQAGIQADAGAMQFHLQDNSGQGAGNEEGDFAGSYVPAMDATEVEDDVLYTPIEQYHVAVETGLDIKV